MSNSMDLSEYEKAPFLDSADAPTSPSSSCCEDIEASAIRTKQSAAGARYRWIRSPWWFCIHLCLFAIAMIFFARMSRDRPSQLQGDITGFIPQFDDEIVTFGSHPQFISNHTSLDSLQQAQRAWIDLLPRGQGYIRVSDSDLKKYDLPAPVEYKGTQSLGTSWMHGLHCLYLLMSEYDMLAMGMRDTGYDTWHMDHCIDYLRQLIMCSGDMALAGGDLPGGSSFLHVPHVCKNYNQMHRYLEDKRDNDAYQFGNHETHFVPP